MRLFVSNCVSIQAPIAPRCQEIIYSVLEALQNARYTDYIEGIRDHLPNKMNNSSLFLEDLELLRSYFWFSVSLSLIPATFPLLGSQAVLKSIQNQA